MAQNTVTAVNTVYCAEYMEDLFFFFAASPSCIFPFFPNYIGTLSLSPSILSIILEIAVTAVGLNGSIVSSSLLFPPGE